MMQGWVLGSTDVFVTISAVAWSGWLLVIAWRQAAIHAVSGASADHFLGFGTFEITLPLGPSVGLGVHHTTFLRRTVNSDRPDDIRRFPELRIFLTWTDVTWPASGVPQPTTRAP